MGPIARRSPRGIPTRTLGLLLLVAFAALIGFVDWDGREKAAPRALKGPSAESHPAGAPTTTRATASPSAALVSQGAERRPIAYQPRRWIDTSGFSDVRVQLRWLPESGLEGARENWLATGPYVLGFLDRVQPPEGRCDSQRLGIALAKANVLNFQGKPRAAYDLLAQTRSWVEAHDGLAAFGLHQVIYCQGVSALRLGETENCVMCRGESSCILPISSAAVHTNPTGSRLAVRHFTEYLERFPDDLAVRWLLNIAHMTLGEHPERVDPRYLVPLDHYRASEFDIGKFRDIGAEARVNRFNMNGGALLEDFDGDGLMDLVVTSNEPSEPMGYFRNRGDGRFEDQTKRAGLSDQLGGISAEPVDYNNDGRLDLFIARGAWFLLPIRPSLLRNDGDGKFTDVTEEAGMARQINAMTSRWADFDNDGWADVLVVCEKAPHRLYRNRGDGTFEEVAERAGVRQSRGAYCKGADWIDYDNDDWPDLFVTDMIGKPRLYHNQHDGTFRDVTKAMGIDGPNPGFSCWAWDYDNDGWLDLFANCNQANVEDVVQGLIGLPHRPSGNRLFHNEHGRRFEDRTKEAGLDMSFAAMGSNFGDFDNDGYLDFYLGTGAPGLDFLVPNRMLKNVGGRRFADITASSGTGNLQKGHGISCGDWDNDGDVDIMIEMGGTVPGDKYHNILFQNPGQGNQWLTVKLVGQKTNRAAIGARIKVVTEPEAGAKPLVVHRLVSSGSSWGANPLRQTIGLGRARKVALLEVHWPTSGATQTFHDIDVDQALEITEGGPDFRRLDWKPVPAPKGP